ncbi:tetraacyldisaccharide 4'-kinase [uncultured Psychroserpens sp.]|uniref:tetraacyldisaccharide 4'-kinase n=1 Tax=uncultured Psychroserpens sp. TaxID=255436 RepID=UPI0026155066|nr:tetraacyldisaccharide 4'-kinase [uncultured Psychroserpens sp.]
MKLLRKILFPFVPVYYVITWLRNKFYDLGWMASKSYDLPIICVGNLSTGGTGKTPTIEYLIRLLNDHYNVATLSRGYKRDTSGFIIADKQASARTIGDEPFQFYKKFDTIVVSVDENRQRGISQLIHLKQPDVILLDDAFQHRKVKPGYTILLTAYDNLYYNDMMLPTGDLREPITGAKRADNIVVTKCPESLALSEKNQILKKINPLAHQKVYFSWISYDETIWNNDGCYEFTHLKGKKVSLVTGIANPGPLVRYLNSKHIDFEHLNYSDHHVFSASEIEVLKQKEVILTTEKDFMRLQDSFEAKSTQLYYLPITFKIDNSDEFNAQLLSYIKSV